MTGSGDPVTPVLFKVGPKNQLLATFLDTSVFGRPDPSTDLVPAFEGFKEIFPFDLWAIRENYILAVSEPEATAWQEVAGKRWHGDIRASV